MQGLKHINGDQSDRNSKSFLVCTNLTNKSTMSISKYSYIYTAISLYSPIPKSARQFNQWDS